MVTPQAVYVCSGICLGRPELLWGCVALGTDTGSIAAGFLLVRPGNAEVDQLQHPVRLEHDIGRLHIPVDDGMGRLPVQVVQHITKVQKPLHAPGFLHSGLPVQKRLERDALHIVEDYVKGHC